MILNLALWFSLRVLFAEVAAVVLGPAMVDVPVLATLDWRAALIALLAGLALFRFRLGVPSTLGGAALLGALLAWHR